MINTNWPRWTRSSIVKHFDAQSRTYNGIVLPLYHGYGDLETALNGAEYGLQLQSSAINWADLGANQYLGKNECRIVIYCKKETKNLYAKEDIQGIVLPMFTDIYVKKWNTDESFVTCLQLSSEYGDPIRVFEYGESKTNLYSLTIIEANYKGEYDGDS